MDALLCRDLKTLCSEFEAGAAAAVLTEQALISADLKALTELLERQPAWSDFPLIILTRGGDATPPAVEALQHLGNVIAAGTADPVPDAGQRRPDGAPGPAAPVSEFGTS